MLLHDPPFSSPHGTLDNNDSRWLVRTFMVGRKPELHLMDVERSCFNQILEGTGYPFT